MIKVFLSLVLSMSLVTAIDWSYKGAMGPDKWGELSKEFVKCKKGIEQSPVNINSSYATLHKGGQYMSVNYKPSTVKIKNTGHTIEVGVSRNDNFIRLNGISYYLTQFHFHSPSEHQIDGRSYPMEIHFVNKSNDDKLAVLGLFVRSGNQSKAFAPIFKNLPKEKMTQRVLKTKVNFNDIFPKKSSYYQYDGSLTTPPCTEGVKWFIFSQPIEMSNEQLSTFSNLYFLNNRPIQPLNKRKITFQKRH